MASHKGPGEAPTLDGSSLRIAIVHARWNPTIITPLLDGCTSALHSSGVKRENIIIESVPGSWELPLACQRVYAASQTQSALSSQPGTSSLLSAGDLLGASASSEDLTRSEPTKPGTTPGAAKGSTAPFDAIVAIGVLIKGDTKHFEYISKSMTEGLMRVQLETGVPVVLGVLTCLTEEQALNRAGKEAGGGRPHNHGEDWGKAAVEMGAKRRAWGEGRFSV